MATHVLVGNSAHMVELKGEMPQANLVSVDWLEACLARQCRISEAEYLFSKPSEGASCALSSTMRPLPPLSIGACPMQALQKLQNSSRC